MKNPEFCRHGGNLVIAVALIFGSTVAGCTPESGGDTTSSSAPASPTTTMGPNRPTYCNPDAIHILGDSNNSPMTATHEALVAARTEKGIPVGMNKAQAGAVTRDVLERQLPALMSELSQMCADDYNRKVIIVSGSNEVSKSAFDPSVDSSSAERDLHDLSVELGEFGFRAIHRFDPVKYGPVWDQPSFQRSRAVAETFKNYRGDTNIEATEIDFLYQGETAFGDPGNYLLGDDKHFDYGKIGLALAEQESAAIARL